MASALLVSSSFLPGRGGIESYLHSLCSTLAPEVAVLAPARRDRKPLPRDVGYPTEGMPRSMLVPSWATAARIAASARERGTSRVIFGTVWPLALLGPRLRRKGLRYCVIAHGAEATVPGAAPGVGRAVARALAGADHVFAASIHTAGRVAQLVRRHGAEPPPIHRLGHIVDTQRFRPEVDPGPARFRLGLGPGHPVVLCFGRLAPRKGVHRLVAAMPAVARAVPGALLVVAGSGPEERRLHRLAASTGAPVTFAGRVDESLAPSLYAASDVFALAVADRFFGLEMEGLGVVLLEAAASGRPCVAGCSGGTPEAVVDDETGYVVDARDPTALSTALIELLADPSLAQRMGAAGRAHVERNFSAGAVPSALIDWLTQDGIPEA